MYVMSEIEDPYGFHMLEIEDPSDILIVAQPLVTAYLYDVHYVTIMSEDQYCKLT